MAGDVLDVQVLADDVDAQHVHGSLTGRHRLAEDCGGHKLLLGRGEMTEAQVHSQLLVQADVPSRLGLCGRQTVGTT